MRLQKLRAWCVRHERPLFIGSLLVGFSSDLIMFRYLDVRVVFLTLFGHLALAGAGIVILNLHEAHRLQSRFFSYMNVLAPLALQFSFGALLSAFVLFYSHSGSLAASWPFIAALVFLMVGNEMFRRFYARPVVQMSVYFFSLFAFANWMIPYLFHTVGPAVFLTSGFVSAAILALFYFGLRLFAPHMTAQKLRLAASVSVILVSMTILYFANAIPPIPLAMRDSGVYHGVRRAGDGYQVLAEERVRSIVSFAPEKFHITPTDRTAYAFSSIFSPARLNIEVVHEWQRRDSYTGAWTTVNSVSFPLIGGRDKGYRGYSWNARVEPGAWRVNVKTTGGQIIGRIAFAAVESDEPHPLKLLVK